MEKMYFVLAILSALSVFASLIRLFVVSRKSRVDWAAQLVWISYYVVWILYCCVKGRILLVSPQVEYWLTISFHCFLAVIMYPTYKAMWQQHKAEKAAQAAQKLAEAQKPLRVPR